jgi:methionyl-tRNA formyltransferase
VSVRRGSPDEPARTIFLGSGQFGVPILDALDATPRVALVGVVSAPDRPSGRRGALTAVPVARRARQLDLRLLQPARIRSADAVASIADLLPDLGVLADYGQIIPSAVLTLPRHGILNVHPSLLPRHRGATPIPATIAAGDREAGVSLIRMDEGLDSGPIVGQEGWPLDGTEIAPELEAEAARRGAILLVDVLEDWLRGALRAIPQDASGVTMTRPLRREDGRLDPSHPAIALERQVRALEPWPGSFIETPDGRLIVHTARLASSQPGDVPGLIVADDGGMALTTIDGRLRLEQVQLAGRRTTDAASLLRGAPGLVGRAVELR